MAWVTACCIFLTILSIRASPTVRPPKNSEFVKPNVVNLNDFKLLGVIGEGSYGKVYLAQKLTGMDQRAYYALKAIDKSFVIQKNKVMEVKREMQVLKSLRHPFLVRLFYTFQTPTQLFLALEFSHGGDLRNYQLPRGPLQEEVAKFYITELVTVLEYLHDTANIAHLDLKAENVLIDSEGHVRLTDFGLCQKLDTNQKTYNFCGTAEYLAPEIVSKIGHGKSADWWSLGILLYELLHGHTPFESYGPSKDNIFAAIRNKKIEFSSELYPNTQAFLKQLLEKNPNKRLGSGGIAEIKDHPYFENVNWNLVINRQWKPPYIPKISGPGDVSNIFKFYSEFVIKANEQSKLAVKDQKQFEGLDYTAPELAFVNPKRNEQIFEDSRVPSGCFKVLFTNCH